MRGRARPEPVIPDHKVLRLVGGGSYGEVWLASGVTGAMRAVKLVRREDFEEERAFEREFEGILKYEPLSRAHPGLIHILHVGRGVDINDNPFYYYVMELGDDVHSGMSINPVEYEARNLLTDMKHSGGTPHDPDEVITIGLSISEALAFLHEKGLVHRDIKPSNIIFVDGKAKLADIGLVAARGQRTFVGTEGFVPPEGPGSAKADVYALGKVLYEMATGRDRLDFPELPDELPAISHKQRWQRLNQLICDVCEPRVSKRNINTAAALADGLERLQTGRRLKRRRNKFSISAISAVVFLSLFTWLLGSQVKTLWVNLFNDDEVESVVSEKPQYGFVKVVSNPDGAKVYDADGVFLDVTPLKNIKMKAGEPYSFEFRLDGYRTGQEVGVIKVGETTMAEHVMVIYSPPVEGQDWVNHNGVPYVPNEGYHVSKHHVSNSRWIRYIRAKKIKKSSKLVTRKVNDSLNTLALVTEKEAINYAEWLSNDARARGYLNDEQSIYAVVDKELDTSATDLESKKSKRYPFKTKVDDIPFARLAIDSIPSGASVFIDDVLIGYTPVYSYRIKPGPVKFTLTYEGYRKISKPLNLRANSSEKLSLQMERNNSVVFGENWENSLGMRFVPIDDKDELLVSIWETRISDFAKLGGESKRQILNRRKANPNHPVLTVSREGAESFCEKLTKHEQAKEMIPEGSRYRLLTDLEWSLIAGLSDVASQRPAERDANSPNIFPWGLEWPPHKKVPMIANLSGEEMSTEDSGDMNEVIEGYNDGYTRVSPVGTFPPNSLGIYDLAGNAYEWVSDNYSESEDYGVLRGSSLNTYVREHLYVGHRNPMKPSSSKADVGFRILLEKRAEN